VTRRAPKQVRDQLGRRLCRVPTCGKVVPKGRFSYCSGECATAFEIAYFPNRTRRHVFNRDHGVCVGCGVDTEKLRRVISWARRFGTGWKDMEGTMREIGFPQTYSKGDFWQADHVRECARGGWGLGLENFRTLCTPCHKKETARLVRELAEQRRAARSAKPQLLFGGAQ
jgi:5-methylcytosine-specific restriction protein A